MWNNINGRGGKRIGFIVSAIKYMYCNKHNHIETEQKSVVNSFWPQRESVV